MSLYSQSNTSIISWDIHFTKLWEKIMALTTTFEQSRYAKDMPSPYRKYKDIYVYQYKQIHHSCKQNWQIKFAGSFGQGT